MPAARFVRFRQITTSTILEISELQLFEGATQRSGTISATAAPAFGSPSNLTDGNLTTRCYWNSATVANSAFAIAFDFGAGNAYAIDGFKQGGFDTSGRHIQAATVEYSQDGVSWSLLKQLSGLSYPGNYTLSGMTALSDGVISARASAVTPLGQPAAVARTVAVARAAVDTPLGAVQVVAETIAPAFACAAAPSPLSTAQATAFFGQSFFVRASATAILGSAQAQAQVVRAVRATAPSPLGEASALAGAWPLVQAYAAAPSVLGNASAVAIVAPMAYASAPSPLSTASAFAMATVSAYAAAPTPLGAAQAVAVLEVAANATLGAVTQFGAPVATSVCRTTESIQLIPFIPPLISSQTASFGAAVAQQEQPIAAPVFGMPSVRFSTSHPAASLEASATFGGAVVRAVHEVSSLESVVFGDGDTPTYSTQVSSLFGQVEFGAPVVRTVHLMGDWYAGIRMGPVGAEAFGSFPILDSIESTEFGAPYLGATVHRAMPLHTMPAFGPITISRSHAC